MLRIDVERREIRASVGALIQEPIEVPRPAGVLAGARAAVGTSVHRTWRREREAQSEGFRGEVTLTHELELDGYHVWIRGRADGVSEEADGHVVVEEVKSVETVDPEPGSAARSQVSDARSQVRLYAYLLARARPDVEVRACLILVSIIDGRRRRLDVPYDDTTAERLLEDLLRDHIRAAEARQARARVRRDVAGSLRFPYARARPHQAELSGTILDALEARRPILATAPTGVGKTVAALQPALQFALGRDALLFFLTAKTTQQTLVAQTFVDIARASGRQPGELQALTFRRKHDMCPPGTLLCHPDHCPYLVKFLERRTRETAIEDLLEGAVHIDPDEVHALGEERTICPHALALSLLMRVDLVICDTNYVYDPGVSFRLFGEDAAAREVVVVLDEAHNLFDRAREYYSPFLRCSTVTGLAERARSGDLLAPGDEASEPELPGLAATVNGPELFAGLADYLDRLASALGAVAEQAALEHPPAMDGCRPVREPHSAWEGVADEAATWLVRYAHYQQIHGVFRYDDEVIDGLYSVTAIRDLLALDEPPFVPYVADADHAPDRAGFGILCVDPAGRLEERHRHVSGSVAMSATLTPLAYYADVLGFSPLDPVTYAAPSPFPAEHRQVCVVPSVSTTWRERRHHYRTIAQAIEAVVASRPGHYVAYFPSFRFLADVREHLALDEDATIEQSPRMPRRVQARVLARLRDDEAPVLLLAVTGGVFAEGIDLPGEALVGAIVVGPSLPQVGFERTAMRQYFDETRQRGFAYAMLFPGMQRVIQAAGRVHRTPEDRGVLVLLGRRFLRTPYVDCPPSHWSRYGPEELVTDARDLRGRLETFWAS